MSNVENKGHQDYSRFDKLSTDILEDFLKADVDAPDAEQVDIETIMYISALLTERKKAAQQMPQKDVATAKAEFYENYYPFKDDEESLYDWESVTRDEPADRPRMVYMPWLRRTVSAAVLVLMLIFTGAATASALGYDPWDVIVEWTDDVFSIRISSGSPTEGLQYIADKYDMPENIIPKWLPDGYEQESIEESVSDVMTKIFATYSQEGQDGTGSIYIELNRKNVDGMDSWYEKDEQEVLIYTASNIEHYILSNLQSTVIVWFNNGVECSIWGEFTKNEAKMMVDSIYEE